MVKCYYCGEVFDASVVPYIRPNARRYAHETCGEQYSKVSTQEEKERKELEEYIKQLFNIDTLTTKITRQISTYRKEKNYSYSGMRKSLIYFFEIKGNSTEKSNNGIGILPYVYEEAYQYWRDIWETQQRNTEKNLQEYTLPPREVHIIAPPRQPMKTVKKLFTFLEDGGVNDEI